MKGFRYVQSEYIGGKVIFRVNQDEDMVCPCHVEGLLSSEVQGGTDKEEAWGDRVASMQRIDCLEYGVIRELKIGFDDERRSNTKAFERYILELSRHMTMLDVARHLWVTGIW